MVQRAEDAAQVLSAQYGAVEVRIVEVDAAEDVHQLTVINFVEVFWAHRAQETDKLSFELV